MKKFLNVLLTSVIMASMISVSAYAGNDDPDLVEPAEFPIEIDITSGNPDIADVDVKVTPVNSTDRDIELYEDVTHNEDFQPRASVNDDVEVSFGIVNGYTTIVRGQYYPINQDLLLLSLPSSYFDGRVYKFTMPNGRVRFDVQYNKNSLSSLGSDDDWIPKANYEDPSPAPIAATTEDVTKSVLPANTISMVTKTGVNLSSVTDKKNNSTISLSARPLTLLDESNQDTLIENLAKLENFDYEVLASYGIYAATNLAPEDFGKKTDLSWKNISDTNISKNARIRAVCFNCYEGCYVIDGTIDEYGNIILKDYIIRPNKTNITVFVVK